MKISRLFLTLAVLLLVGFIIGQVLLARQHLLPRALEVSSEEAINQRKLPTETVLVTSDTITGSYKYLWSNFPRTIIKPSLGDKVVVNYLDGDRHLVNIKTSNDTLFILRNKEVAYFSIPSDKDPMNLIPMDVFVGADQLESIHVSAGGNVQNYFFHLQNTADNAIKRKKLKIHLESGANGVFDLEVETLQLSTYGEWYSSIYLKGKARNMKANVANLTSFDACNFIVDSVYLNLDTPTNFPHSALLLHAEAYLKANLDGWVDVVYFGNPTVYKTERSVGRLLDGNLAGKPELYSAWLD